MRLEKLNNLLLNTVTPNFVAIFVFFGTASSFIERISFSEIEAKREAILFLFGYSEAVVGGEEYFDNCHVMSRYCCCITRL